LGSSPGGATFGGERLDSFRNRVSLLRATTFGGSVWWDILNFGGPAKVAIVRHKKIGGSGEKIENFGGAASCGTIKNSGRVWDNECKIARGAPRYYIAHTYNVQKRLFQVNFATCLKTSL
jgi:hypothetical protein